VTYNFTGRIDTVINGPVSPDYSSEIGQSISGTFSYDPSAPPTGIGSFGGRTFGNALLSATLNIGGLGNFVGQPPLTYINVLNNDPIFHDDFYLLANGTGTEVNSFKAVQFFFDLVDTTQTLFSTDTTLPLAPALSDFDSRRFYILSFFFDKLQGDITSLTLVTTTPLPAALPLFASGFGVLGLLGYLRRRKAAATAA